MASTRTVTTEGTQTVITETDSAKPGQVTRWAIAPNQLAKMQLDASVASAISAAAPAVQDSIAAAIKA
jgi:hypothetical protein